MPGQQGIQAMYGVNAPAAPWAAKARSAPTWIAVAAVAALVGALVGGAVGGVLGRASERTVVEKFFPNRSVLARPADVQAVLAKVMPAVVSIDTETFRGQSIFSGSFVEGAGTGMIITPSGEVLTNNHVVAGASTVTVTLYGQSVPRAAKVVGTDPADDLALVKIQGVSNLPTVQLGNSGTTQVGDSVLAIGNALALAGGPTVTEGIVSAEGRQLSAVDPLTGAPEHLSGLIQTDAAINPGNSGGPLVDSAGQVIGINTAVASSSGGNAPAQDIGFAIAINTAKPIIPLLQRGGTHPASTHPGGAFMGVGVVTVTPAIASADHLAVSTGALVVDVTPGGPAYQAGIEVGDVIVKVDSTPVTSAASLTNVLVRLRPGTLASVTVQRGSEQLSVGVALAARP
ncbi:MAG: trypsin-like peptidase domain-containing protein [Actinomycetota bacterium]|nr:trypsin-like peptidase domain-containing protein [Actinomycetota bacterium]